MNDKKFDGEALERGRRLFAQACDFVIGAAHLEQVPETDCPEVAFAGRSNVGKSSLINALTKRKTLARTSNTPGRTQQINFFILGGRLMLADLPGYGYAKAPKIQVEHWIAMVNTYLEGRAELRRTCLLIDSRHGVKDSDREIMKMLDATAQPYQAVLTKCDKITPPKLALVMAETGKELATLPAAHPEVMATSAKEGTGIDQLRASLALLAAD